MNAPFPTMSLRTKLVLSYLAVALGAILVLTIVVALVIQNYFASTQRDLLRSQALYRAHYVEHIYRSLGGSWDRVPTTQIQTNDPILLVVVDTTGREVFYTLPAYLHLRDDDSAVFKQALSQALQGQEVDGNLQGSGDANTFSGIYISVPLHEDSQPNGKIIGALLVAQPNFYPENFSPDQFLINVNQAILITGLIVAAVVVIFSLMLVRRLTQPLALLTAAAEQMKSGNYAQRVLPPKSEDELGRLALTFNAMANTIEADVNELRLQEQLRRDLLANIAHDLATPLSAIQGFSEALADDVIADPVARQETAQLIGREVQRMRRLVGEMQQMTSFESGRARIELAPLDLASLVDETLAVIAPECELADISLHNEIVPGTPPALADSDRITQVLLNLLDHARRHTPSGGTITVAAHPVG